MPGYNPARVTARPNALQLVGKLVQPASNTDLYLDTFFNPVWMSGPHVFSFTKDGTVMRPEIHPTEPFPEYQASAVSSGHGLIGIGPSVSAGAIFSGPLPSFPRVDISKTSERTEKPWKNVAITEQDEAEFAAMVAEAETRMQAEAKGKLVGLVYSWPPKPHTAACPECEVLARPRRRWMIEAEAKRTVPKVAGPWVSLSTGTQESAVLALSYGSSGESESNLEMFQVVPGRGVMTRWNEVPLEKVVGFGRVARKAPKPARLAFARVEASEDKSG